MDVKRHVSRENQGGKGIQTDRPSERQREKGKGQTDSKGRGQYRSWGLDRWIGGEEQAGRGPKRRGIAKQGKRGRAGWGYGRWARTDGAKKQRKRRKEVG